MTGAVNTADWAPRSWWQALRRGFGRRCPNCGKGRLFSSFVTVNGRCDVCGEDFSHQRAEDAPPYFTITIVAHIIIPSVLITERVFHPSAFVHFILWLPLTLVLTLLLMPSVKGAVIGVQWAQRMHGFGDTPRQE
ncbi:DUF983 domain-containing protein [soil metagenome]